MPKMCSFAAKTCAPKKKKKKKNPIFRLKHLLGGGGGFGVSFIRHRHENWVKLDVYCRHSQIHPWIPSWPNFHKLAIEGLKHLCFWFFGEVAGERGCCVFDFMVH